MVSDQFQAKPALADQPADDLVSWWHNFADPVLDQLVEQALANNLTVQEAAERIVEARANVRLTGGDLAPNVDYLSGWDFLKRAPNARPFAGDNIGGSFSLFRFGFDSLWEIDLFGRIARSIEAAQAELAVEEFSLKDVQQTLIADVATCYLTIRLIQDQLFVIDRSIELQQDTVVKVAQRQTAGVSTRLDTEQTNAFLHRSRAGKIVLEQQLAVEFNRLSVLLGQSPSIEIREFIGVAPIPVAPTIPETGIPADLIRRRPDVRRSEAEVAAATARIGIAEADLYPSLTLIGTISLSAQDISSLFQTDSFAFSLGPSFRWNILHFGRICDNIEIHESQLRQTIAAYRNTILQAVGEVEDAMVQYDGFRKQLVALQDAQQADLTAVQLSLQRYKVGKTSFQRVLDAQLQLLQDSQATAQARANANIQLIRMYRAAGGGWPGPGSATTLAVDTELERLIPADGVPAEFPVSSPTAGAATQTVVPTSKPVIRELDPRPIDDDSFFLDFSQDTERSKSYRSPILHRGSSAVQLAKFDSPGEKSAKRLGNNPESADSGRVVTAAGFDQARSRSEDVLNSPAGYFSSAANRRHQQPPNPKPDQQPPVQSTVWNSDPQ